LRADQVIRLELTRDREGYEVLLDRRDVEGIIEDRLRRERVRWAFTSPLESPTSPRSSPPPGAEREIRPISFEPGFG
jgi:hypothetical protein